VSFVVDGADWAFDGLSSESVQGKLDQLLATFGRATARGETVWIGDELQTKPVLGQLDVWQLWSAESPVQIEPEVCQELAAYLGRFGRYADDVNWPPTFGTDFAVQVGGVSIENPDVSWAHHSQLCNRFVACIGTGQARVEAVSSLHGTTDIHWVVDDASQSKSWRSAIGMLGGTLAALESLAPHAYPNLYFHGDSLRDARHLDGGFTANRNALLKHLEVLDDFGEWILCSPPPALSPDEPIGDETGAPSNQTIQRRFIGFGLDVAPENPNVWNDPRCRAAREISLHDRKLYCEWHCKLEPHRNRIHIHRPVEETGNRVIIAIIHPHLPLP
jgi:hypothetical protein